jgi:hypothetical protein
MTWKKSRKLSLAWDWEAHAVGTAPDPWDGSLAAPDGRIRLVGTQKVEALCRRCPLEVVHAAHSYRQIENDFLWLCSNMHLKYSTGISQRSFKVKSLIRRAIKNMLSIFLSCLFYLKSA